MPTKYPIILAHGIVLRDVRILRRTKKKKGPRGFNVFKAFGQIETDLRAAGYTVCTAKSDGLGTIENNATQLKRQILHVLRVTGAEKVNIIAHSKGGLDTRYMLAHLGMEDKVASVTFLCTPHKGSEVATKIYALPAPAKEWIAFWLNFWYRRFGDRAPDALEVCRQLVYSEDGVLNTEHGSEILMQSYSATLHRFRDDPVMGIPLRISKRAGSGDTDGLVSVESSKFADYKGDCVGASVSHSEIVDFLTRKKKKATVYAFYRSVCADLADRGY